MNAFQPSSLSGNERSYMSNRIENQVARRERKYGVIQIIQLRSVLNEFIEYRHQIRLEMARRLKTFSISHGAS